MIGLEHVGTSLIPRLFLPPVFDRLQHANMEGEGLEDLSRMQLHWVDTQGAVPDSNNSIFVSNCPWHRE